MKDISEDEKMNAEAILNFFKDKDINKLKANPELLNTPLPPYILEDYLRLKKIHVIDEKTGNVNIYDPEKRILSYVEHPSNKSYVGTIDDVNNELIELISHEKHELIEKLFEYLTGKKTLEDLELPEPNATTYYLFVEHYNSLYQYEKSLNILERMKSEGTTIPIGIFNLLLDASFKTDDLNMFKQVHEKLTLEDVDPNERTYGIRISTIGQDFISSKRMFERMKKNTQIAYTLSYGVLLTSYIRNNRISECEEVVKELFSEEREFDYLTMHCVSFLMERNTNIKKFVENSKIWTGKEDSLDGILSQNKG